MLTHDEALADDSWFEVDVLLVDAADERCDDDHFPGVDVVNALRRQRSAEETTVVVITGHYFDDAIRKRMREARADLFFHRTQIQDAADLCGVIADPGSVAQSVPDPRDTVAMSRLGVDDATKVNSAVRFARDQDWLGGELHRPGRRSRSFDHLREAFGRTARVNAVNTDGTPPHRDQDDPSRPQIARLIDWATRIKR